MDAATEIILCTLLILYGQRIYNYTIARFAIRITGEAETSFRESDDYPIQSHEVLNISYDGPRQTSSICS